MAANNFTNYVSTLRKAQCCFGKEIHEAVQKTWKGESLENFPELMCKFMNIKVAERALAQTANTASYFDLSDLTNPLDVAYAYNVADGATVYASQPTLLYSTVEELINSIVTQINSGGIFSASATDQLIYINAVAPQNIGTTLTLTLVNPFAPIDNPAFAPNNITFTYGVDATTEGTQQGYITDDSRCIFVYGVSATVTTVVITDIDGNVFITKDTSGYFCTNIFGSKYNPTSQRLYVALRRTSDSINGIGAVDCDKNSGTYGEVVQFFALNSVDNNMFGVVCHPTVPLNYFCAEVVSSGDVKIYITDYNGNVGATITKAFPIPAVLGYQFSGLTIRSNNLGFAYNSNIYIATTKRILIIDGNPISGTYNTIIGDLDVFTGGAYSIQTMIRVADKIVFLAKDVGVFSNDRIYTCDLDLTNLTLVQTIPLSGGSNGFFALQFVSGLYFLGGVGIYKIYDYELVEIQESTITNNLTQSVIYFATATNNNKLFYNYITSKAVVVFEAETTPYTYDLNGINLTETLNCITEPQLKSVLAEISGCDCCGEEGTFGEDSSYILQGDAPNTYIDANGQPIST